MAYFGDLVKIELIRQKATQKQLAGKINLTTNAVNSLLNRDNISLDKMKMLADALNCELKIELIPKK